MLFGDEERFKKRLVQTHPSIPIQGFIDLPTDSHVGPGSYIINDSQEKRSGLLKSTFSNRQPMQPPRREVERSEYICGGFLSPSGTMSIPSSLQKRLTPGPGAYDVNNKATFIAPVDPVRREDLNISGSSPSPMTTRVTNAGTNMPTTPRFSFNHSACLTKGVILQSALNEVMAVDGGPGYYDVEDNGLIKKSHNVRATATSKPLHHSSPSNSSPSKISPSKTFKQIPPGSSPHIAPYYESSQNSISPSTYSRSRSNSGASGKSSTTPRSRSNSGGGMSRSQSNTGLNRSK